MPTESDAGSLNVINALPVDQYVKGVIPNESPPSWPAAELQAQAVASRSFALTASVGGNGFDLYDDTRSQVYDGLASETAAHQRRRRRDQGPGRHLRRQDRRDLLLGLLGRPHRERPERLLRPADPLPGRRPRPLRLLLPAARLDAQFSGPEISAKLGGYLDGKLKQIVVTKRGVSPRIVWAPSSIGTGGMTKIRGDQLEAALGGYGSWMSFRRSSRQGGGVEAAPGPAGGVSR